MIPDTLDLLRDIAKELFGTPVTDWTPDTTLADVGSDSLLFLEFVLMCEDWFDVDLDQYADQITEKSTFGEIVTFIDLAIERAKEET